MRTQLHLPLQWLISLVTLACLLLFSGFLTYQSYQANRATLLDATADSAQQLAANLDTQALRMVVPIRSVLQLLTFDPLHQAKTRTQRRERIPVLANTLRSNPLLSAVYAGYPDGSFMLLRTVKHPALQAQYKVPQGSVYMLQSLDYETGQRRGEQRFYSAQLQLIEHREAPNYVYDPRSRDWYQQAQSTDAAVLTRPYTFFTTGETGISLAQRNPETGTVIGMDASLADLSMYIQELRLTPGTELAIINRYGDLLATKLHDPGILNRPTPDHPVRWSLENIQAPALRALQNAGANEAPARLNTFTALDGSRWFGTQVPMLSLPQEQLQLLIAFPAEELLARTKENHLRQLSLSLVIILLVMLVLAWAIGFLVSRPLSALNNHLNALTGFDFTPRPQIRSMVKEVDTLGAVLQQMSTTIYNFQAINRTLAQEQDLDQMLETINQHLVKVTGATTSALYLYDDERRSYTLASLHGTQQLPARLEEKPVGELSQVLPEALLHAQLVPLLDRSQNPQGLLVMDLPDDLAPQALASLSRFIAELSSSAAIAIETRQLLESQQALIDAIVRLLADAIDAKSPYTSGHCERVPHIAEMLADAAQACQQGELADFHLSEAQRYEFRTAAWLHDCGKITSPEHIIDKATKLETLYNRIHEIRTRFEVLWRDAEINCLQRQLAGEDPQALKAELTHTRQQLQEDFAFVAQTNIGGEFLADEAINRLQAISQRTWQRNFSDRLGLSGDEAYARRNLPEETLPVCEHLLADKPEHITPWNGRRPPVEADNPANKWGFDMQLPEHELNKGELYNLGLRRGTLTPEERFKVNDHIVQTICMLSALPLPHHLKRLPEIAGNHHERFKGGGYPRNLKASELSIEERIMAVADIFEALTASDRPYKAAKTLSQSLQIMARMTANGHLDPVIFRLMLEHKVYLEYASRFLSPEQCDSVDHKALLETAGA